MKYYMQEYRKNEKKAQFIQLPKKKAKKSIKKKPKPHVKPEPQIAQRLVQKPLNMNNTKQYSKAPQPPKATPKYTDKRYPATLTITRASLRVRDRIGVGQQRQHKQNKIKIYKPVDNKDYSSAQEDKEKLELLIQAQGDMNELQPEGYNKEESTVEPTPEKEETHNMIIQKKEKTFGGDLKATQA